MIVLCTITGITSHLHYPNNTETAYYIEGDVEYTWNDGKCSHEFYQVNIWTRNDNCDAVRSQTRRSVCMRRAHTIFLPHYGHLEFRTMSGRQKKSRFYSETQYSLQADRREGDGASITMDQNEPHVLNARSIDCITLCVFYPALKGTETHDFSKAVSSF